MAEITYQMILSTIQTVGLLVGIFYYIMTLQNTRKNQKITIESRQAQLYMTIFNTINNQEIWKLVNEIRQYTFKNYDDFMEKYGPIKNPEAYAKLTKVWWLFTEMGALVYQGYISLEDCSLLMSTTPLEMWSKYGSVIEGLRANYWNSSEAYGTFEYLAKMQLHSKKESSAWMRKLLDAIPDVIVPSLDELSAILEKELNR